MQCHRRRLPFLRFCFPCRLLCFLWLLLALLCFRGFLADLTVLIAAFMSDRVSCLPSPPPGSELVSLLLPQSLLLLLLLLLLLRRLCFLLLRPPLLLRLLLKLPLLFWGEGPLRSTLS